MFKTLLDAAARMLNAYLALANAQPLLAILVFLAVVASAVLIKNAITAPFRRRARRALSYEEFSSHTLLP